jgi:thioesterase domain-containing protein
VHSIESYVGSWQGTRLFEGGLIVGRNATGCKAPLFWVFQSEDEFQALARHLGPDQPVYGSRSLVNIYPVKDYTADRIQAVVDRYLWEILAMPVAHPVLLGGNCQGAIVALALAKTMKRIQKAPALLVLMEWSFSYGPYSDPTLLIHGSESHTAEIYSSDSKSTIDWKGDFPNHTVASTPGGHGRFFEEPNVEPLARLLRQQFDAHASPIIHRPKL